MRVQTEEWRRFIPGIRMYKGKMTLFWNGEKLRENGEWLLYNEEERRSWEVIIVLPGVEIIPVDTFIECENVKTVIMADTVRRIARWTFTGCMNLMFVKLSRNLEYIGYEAFAMCVSLTSIFIPPSCREIDKWAFSRCWKLIILGLPQPVQLGEEVFQNTALITKSPFEVDPDNINNVEEEVVNAWIKSINDGEGLALHRICSSDIPNTEQVYGYMKEHGLHVMKLPNSIGITPSQYLAANPYSEMEEGKLVKRYVLEMMGEFVQEQA